MASEAGRSIRLSTEIEHAPYSNLGDAGLSMQERPRGRTPNQDGYLLLCGES